MLSEELIAICESFFKKKITNYQPVFGGSINDAFQIKVGSDIFFIKKNDSPFAFEMFEKEAKGLELLKSTNSIKIPNIIKIGKAESSAFLILENIEIGKSNDFFWEKFGRELAELHRIDSKVFGLDHSNYIGLLPQSNTSQENFIDFYIEERMLPQINLANKNQHLSSTHISKFHLFFKKLNTLLPIEKPSLIHGDLWNGNFLVGKNETPILIDPSVSYSSREMDLAMAMLFGGFDKKFYISYNESFPLQPNFEKRVKVYQLYYLMVHVNLFGKSYLRSVENILDEYVK